mgnify:CR=1 FL=1
MTKQDLTNHLAYTLGLSHSEARTAVDLIFSSIVSALIRSEDVKITDFASFRIVDKAPRNYRNQVTGEMESSCGGKRVKVRFAQKVTDALISPDSSNSSQTTDEVDVGVRPGRWGQTPLQNCYKCYKIMNSCLACV